MDHDAAQQFGARLKHLRIKQGLDIRTLATAAGIDSGGLTRLEHGKVRNPQPTTLRALATTLQVPLADLFAMAGYVIPQELPSIMPYLRLKYSCLPEEVIYMIGSEIEHLAAIQRKNQDDPEDQKGVPDNSEG